MFFKHTLPFQFSHWGHIFFTPEGDRHISRHQAVTLYNIPFGRVIAKDGVVMLDDATIVDELLQFLNTWKPGGHFAIINDKLSILRSSPVNMPGKYFLGTMVGDDNYAHWVTYGLPAWLYFREELMPKGVKLVLGNLTKFHREALRLLGINSDAIFVMPDQIVVFEQLSMMSPINMWCPPRLLAGVGQTLANLADMAKPGLLVPKRIYLSRRDVDRRRLLNEEKLVDMLSLHGFISIACSELSFDEQVRTFSKADIVIGVHGAALGNTLFCRRGTRVIEVFPEYCAQPHFRALADRAGLSYGYVLGTSFEPENGREKSAAWDRDFVVDVQEVESAVKKAIHPII